MEVSKCCGAKAVPLWELINTEPEDVGDPILFCTECEDPCDTVWKEDETKEDEEKSE